MSRSFTALIHTSWYPVVCYIPFKVTDLLYYKFTAQYLNILLMFQQRCFHDIAKAKIPRFHIKGVACNISQALPMSGHHCLVVKANVKVQFTHLFVMSKDHFTLLAIMYSRGQVSLKSSIVFFRSLNACHSFRAEGSLRILEKILSNSILV